MSDELRRLAQAIPALEEAAGVRLVVIGGLARGAWAVPRSTLDVDVIADAHDLSGVLAAAAAGGLVENDTESAALRQSNMARLRLPEHLRGRIRLDVLANVHGLYDGVFQRHTTAILEGVSLRVASAEDLVILKAMAGRAQDIVDLEAVVAAQGDALDHALIRAELEALGFDVPMVIR
jgi:predicted nucleotidyltransferase